MVHVPGKKLMMSSSYAGAHVCVCVRVFVCVCVCVYLYGMA